MTQPKALQKDHDVPKSQKPKVYRIQEKTKGGRWVNKWRVTDQKKTAYNQYKKAEKGSVPRYAEEKEYRLVECWREGTTIKERVMQGDNK